MPRAAAVAVPLFLLLNTRQCQTAAHFHIVGSPPGPVGQLHFQNVTHSSAVLRWQLPALGDWQWAVEGYKIRERSFVYAERAFDIDGDRPDHGLGGTVNASGLICSCDDLCLMELTKPLPCQLRNEETWTILGHEPSTYQTCHDSCCESGRCGTEIGIRGSRRSLQESDPQCPDCECTSDNSSLPNSQYVEVVEGTVRRIISNGIPAHEISSFENRTGPEQVNRLCQVRWQFGLPAAPQLAGAPTPLPPTGIVGVALNGVPYFSPRGSDGSNVVAGGAPCTGRADANNAWHYYEHPTCLLVQGPDDHIGFALDGFPIYGPLQGTASAVDAQLDICNGRTMNGAYRYHIRTRDQVLESLPYANASGSVNWKYVLGCFSGTPHAARLASRQTSRSGTSASVTPIQQVHSWGYAGFLSQMKNQAGTDQSAENFRAVGPGEVLNSRETVNAQTPDSYGDWRIITAVPGTKPGLPNPDLHHVLYGLKPDTLYYYQVSAYNLDSGGPWGVVSYALHTHAIPDQPDPVEVISKTHSSLTLALSPPSTRGTKDCASIANKDIKSGECTTWGTGSPVVEYEIVVYFTQDNDTPGGEDAADGSGAEVKFRLPTLRGCMDPSAINYVPDANQDSGGCTSKVSGCNDIFAFNFDPTVPVNFHDPGACISKTFGCTRTNATNYNQTANVDDGSCYNAKFGCTNVVAQNWDVTANVDDGSCIIENVWIGGRRRAQGTALTGDFTVTVGEKTAAHPWYYNGSTSAYRINGAENVTLNLTRGRTYVFDLNWSPGTHPLYVTTDSVGGGPGVVADGVDNQLATGTGQLTFTPAYDLPDVLYYQCYFHEYMGGEIHLILDEVNYPAPSDELYPACLESCWRNSSSSGGNATNSNNSAALADWDPTMQPMPDWFNFGSVCNWLGAVFVDCNTGPRDELNFSFVDGCQNSCIDECTTDLRDTGFQQLSQCPFGCDANAQTGGVGYDACGVCGGDGSSCMGCTDPIAQNFNAEATINSGDCSYVFGCMDSRALNYNLNATRDSESCSYPSIKSCHALANPFTQCTNFGLSTHIHVHEERTASCLEWIQDPEDNSTVCVRADPEAQQNLRVSTSGCPDHPYSTFEHISSCNPAMAHHYEFVIPKNPNFLTGGSFVNVTIADPVAVAVNGVPIFYGNEYNFTSTMGTSPFNSEFDACQGHVGVGSRYQYRQPPLCLLRQLGGSLIAHELWDTPEICSCNSSSSGVYDAAHAVMNATEVAANRSGHTGDGYVLLSSSALGSSVSFNVRSCIEGTYTMRITYSSESNASVSIVVNGETQHSTVMLAASMNAWVEVEVSISVQNGTNTVAIVAVESEIFIDNIVVDGCPGCGNDEPANIRDVKNWPSKGFPSPLVGWALDGFAVYGPFDEYGNLTVPMLLGGHLDECNGRIGADGRYRYHLTPLSPFTIGCFRGVPGRFDDPGVTEHVCPPDGEVIIYIASDFVYPECNPECMPACVSRCVDEWAWFRPASRPHTGLLPNNWGAVPRAPRIYHVPASLSEYTIENLDSCTSYSVKISASNIVGKSAASTAIEDSTNCRPPQPRTVKPLAVTDTAITVAWDHVPTDLGSPILSYRLFISQLENGPSGDDNLTSRWTRIRPIDEEGQAGSSERQYIFRANESELLTRPSNMAWNLRAGMWAEARTPAVQEAAQQMEMTVSALLPSQAYKFRITALNAAGESFASYDSAVVKTNDAVITRLQIFAGHPCVYNDGSKVPFHAISDGTNVKYQWRTSWGGRAGFCHSDDCSAMTHSFSSSGQFQIIVYASNSRGFRGQIVYMDARPCGCTDPFNDNYWFAARHHVPKVCTGYNWDQVEKSMSLGEMKFFSFPLAEKTFGAQLTLRVDIGAVDFLVSTTQLPDWRMANTFLKSASNVTSFVTVDLDYNDLYDVLKYDASDRVLVAAVAKSDFARFDVYAKRSDFSRGANGLALRRNLDQEYKNNQVSSGYYDFWEYYLPQSASGKTTDITISYQVFVGCITIYASKYERYPSPLRAHSSSYGHDASLSLHGCSGTESDRLQLNITFGPNDPRTLYMSVYGGKVFVLGSRQPFNQYTVEPAYQNMAAEEESSTIRAHYQASVAANATAAAVGPPEPEPESDVEQLEGIDGEVHNMGWMFYDISCDQFSTAVTIQVTQTSGEVTLYKRTGSQPRKGSYDLKVRDTDGDNVIQFTVPFNEIGSAGSFHLGVYGEGAGLLFNINTYARSNGYTLTVIDEGFECAGDYFSCGGLLRVLEDEVAEHDLTVEGEYRYYSVDLDSFLRSEKWDNTTGIEFGTVATEKLFSWTAPYSVDYVSQNFEHRIVNVLFNISASPVSGVNPLNPIACMLFGSTDDPFPGHTRTYQVWREFTFTDVYTDDGEVIFASIELPIFTFSPLIMHFSVTCDVALPITSSITITQFDRGELISKDPKALQRACPGETAKGDLVQWSQVDDGISLACNGHGSCVDEGEYDNIYSNGTWTTAAPICYCNPGWLGEACSIEQFPKQSYIRILSPQPGETMDADECAPCVPIEYGIEYANEFNPSTTAEELLDPNRTNSDWFKNGPYREMYQFEALGIDSLSQSREGCPPCGPRGVQVVYEIDVPAADCRVQAYVDGVAHAATASNQNYFSEGNVTQRFVVHDLDAGDQDAPLEHSLHLFVTYGASEEPIGSTYVNFFVAEDPNICPKGCSNHGICHHSYCVCYDGWLGEACDTVGVEPQHDFHPYAAFSAHLQNEMDTSMDAKRADLDFTASHSSRRLQHTDGVISEGVLDGRARIDQAAAHNREQVTTVFFLQNGDCFSIRALAFLCHNPSCANSPHCCRLQIKEFLSKMAAAAAGQNTDDVATTDWTAAIIELDTTLAELAALNEEGAQQIETDYLETQMKLVQAKHQMDWASAQKRAKWNMVSPPRPDLVYAHHGCHAAHASQHKCSDGHVLKPCDVTRPNTRLSSTPTVCGS